ncbi:DUF4238 domain-containing protein [Streptomyces sp. NPDC020747]|uniref:DUF4238 domain-containing protein n=1 Tax=Streptomyces sp. NPDC020747 TaxID=3365086 RepID=UPI0037B1A7FB
MGANTAKEHHLVPQYWLRAFAEDGHVLGRRRGGAEYRTPVRRAAVARHFNTDPLAEGARRVALETYLDRHVDGPSAPVLRAAREGRWPLEEARQAVMLDALAWQVVRTQVFRSFDAQVGRHVFPAAWAVEAVGHCEERLGRPLSEEERMEVFWTAVRTAPDPCVVSDPRAALRASIRAFQRTRDLLASPGRRLVLLRSKEPLLVLADGGVALRRRDGTFCITPPLLSDTIEVFAPLSPRCLLISTSRAHYRAGRPDPQDRGQGQRRCGRLVPGRRLPAALHVLARPTAARRCSVESPGTEPVRRSRAAPTRPRPGSPQDPPRRSARHPGAAQRGLGVSASVRQPRYWDVTSASLTGAASADPVRFQLSLR